MFIRKVSLVWEGPYPGHWSLFLLLTCFPPLPFLQPPTPRHLSTFSAPACLQPVTFSSSFYCHYMVLCPHCCFLPSLLPLSIPFPFSFPFLFHYPFHSLLHCPLPLACPFLCPSPTYAAFSVPSTPFLYIFFTTFLGSPYSCLQLTSFVSAKRWEIYMNTLVCVNVKVNW